MAEDSVAETGAADPNAAAAVSPILPPEPIAASIPPLEAAGAGATRAVPEPFAPAESQPGSRRTDALTAGASVAGHLLVGLLVFGSFSWPPAAPDVIPVKLVPPDQAPPQKPKPPEKQTPPAGQQKAAQPPPPKPSPAQPKPKDVPVPQKPPEQAEKTPPPATPQTDGPKKDTQWGDIATSLGIADYGRKTALADKLLAAVTAQVSRCWSIPSGWSDPQQVSVTLRFQLTAQGALDGDPSIVRFPATPAGVAAAKAAIKAVTDCGPYHLPAAQYDQWKDVQLTLVP